MAGLLAPEETMTQPTKPREEDLFTRTLVAGGQQALNNEQLGSQVAQLAKSGSDPANGVGIALTVLLSNMRNSIVEQGNSVPMDLLFIPKGAAEILAEDIAELAGAPPEAAKAAVGIAQQMIMQTDEAALAGQQQAGAPQSPTAPQQGQGAPMPPPGAMPPSAAPQGLLAGGV